MVQKARCVLPLCPPGHKGRGDITTISGAGLSSPSTAAAARLRERRGGPGGPAGLLREPVRPSCTSCRWGALKGFARARCATDENIFLREERAAVRVKVSGPSGRQSHRHHRTPTRAFLLPASAPLRRSWRPPPRRSTRPTAYAAPQRGSVPRTHQGQDPAHSLPKMANTQPLPRKGCGSQRPNVLPTLRSVPFVRRQRDAHYVSLQQAAPIGGKERRGRSVTAFS